MTRLRGALSAVWGAHRALPLVGDKAAYSARLGGWDRPRSRPRTPGPGGPHMADPRRPG
jgi:hypothetical protein